VPDFPTIVYRSPGLHAGEFGKTYESKGVADAGELAAALAAGFHRTLIDACRPSQPVAPAEVPADDAPPTRAELEQHATELGLKFDGRTTDRRLAALITEAIDKGA
jgi:N-formylglutamate amidohydrolase